MSDLERLAWEKIDFFPGRTHSMLVRKRSVRIENGIDFVIDAGRMWFQYLRDIGLQSLVVLQGLGNGNPLPILLH